MPTVEVKGLKEFNTALGRVRDELPTTAQEIALHAVTITVADAVPTIPRRSGTAARSVQGYATNEGASVQGGHDVDYYAWLELGGRSGRNLSNVRRFVPDGRYINPAYERNKERIQRDAEDMFTQAARRAGLEVD